MKTIYFILVFFLLSTFLYSTIINVPGDQPTIQAGINVAVDTDTVLVQPGAYVENINYNGNNITVASLFLTTQDTIYISQTIIDGDENGFSVVAFGSGVDSTAVLCGFTITNGSSNHGGGIKCSGSSPILQNVTIINNYAHPFTLSGCGGGIYCSNSSLSLLNVTITGNSAGGFGGVGGGIYCQSSSPSLENVIIAGNLASYSGGGIFCSGSSPSLINVTLSDNTANHNGGGISCSNSSPSLINCIMWNDSPQEVYFLDYSDPNSITLSYSDIQGGEAGIVTNNNATVNWLEGNIDDDPLFAGIGGYPYMLQDLSPCVNAGIPDTTGLNLPEFDLAGNPRVYGGRIDMGAYENQNVIVNTDEILIPLVTKLNQNYPNPFNPTTTINYSLKENSKVSLNIYNIKGQKVKQLISEQLPAGQHSVIWNGKDENNKSVSSGIYFYKLKTENYEKTKRMVLIK